MISSLVIFFAPIKKPPRGWLLVLKLAVIFCCLICDHLRKSAAKGSLSFKLLFFSILEFLAILAILAMPTHTSGPKPQAKPEIESLYTRGHGNWERYEGPQSVGLQAFLGFPTGAAPGQTSCMMAEIDDNVNMFLSKKSK
jgi:hypothetical protein